MTEEQKIALLDIEVYLKGNGICWCERYADVRGYGRRIKYYHLYPGAEYCPTCGQIIKNNQKNKKLFTFQRLTKIIQTLQERYPNYIISTVGRFGGYSGISLAVKILDTNVGEEYKARKEARKITAAMEEKVRKEKEEQAIWTM